MKKQKKKWPWIVLIVIFTLIMIADVIIWGITSKMSSGFNKDFSGFPGQRPDMASSTDSEADDSDGSNKPDFSNFEGMTPPGDGEKPDFSSSDGERPSFPDGEKPDFSNSDGEKPDFSDFEKGMTPPGNMKGKGFLFSIKKFCLPILIICILVDAFSIIMLVLAIKSNKSGPDDPENGDNIDGYDNNNYTDSNTDNPQTPRHNSRIAMIVVPVLVIGIITTLGILTKNKNETATTGVAADETVMEASLEEASMSSVISAGGSVTTEESENDYYPEGIEISKYYVKEGDTVSEGDLIADVDKVSVMNTIKTVEDTIESLDKELESVSDEATENITASAGGRIKKIYASEGGAVKDTVRDNGALMVLSLDGCMAVDIESDEKINIGEKVEVTVGDDEVSGRVTALKDQIITVTIDDEYGSVDENAKVTYEDKELGSGSLYVHQALQMTGYEGTVSEICVAENEEISKGDTVIKLTDGAYSAKYEQLLKQREKLEKQMKSLFELYQSEKIYVKQSGEVTDLNDSFENVGFSESVLGNVSTVKLSNSPTGEDDSGYVNFAVLVTSIDEAELQVKMSANALGDIDLTTVANIGTAICTNAGSISKGVISRVYGYNGSEWVQQSSADITVGEVVVASFDTSGNLIWIVRSISSQSVQPDSGSPQVTPSGTQPPAETTPETPADNTQAAVTPTPAAPAAADGTDTSKTDDSKKDNSKTDKTQNGMPDGNDTTKNNSGLPSANNGSGAVSGANTTIPGASISGFGDSVEAQAQEEQEIVYTVNEINVVSISPCDTVDIDITIDELDIAKISLGKTCNVTFDAISGKEYEGKVTAIDTAGTNEGGNTKYTVTITLDKEADMLSGMNAHIAFTDEEKSNVQTVPASAIVEDGDKEYVYTGYDSENDELTGLKEVTTGISDGENVEILDGLDETDTIYYRYADSLTYSF